MRTSTVIATFAAAGLAAAVPVASSSPQGISIPLRKRTNVGTSLAKGGVIQPGGLARHMERVERKYHRGNKAYKKHNGVDLFANLGKVNVKRQNVPLTDENEQLWAGEISIGTPGQPFLIDFDTGSADLWVPSSLCTDSGCQNKNTYTPSSSSTTEEVATAGNFNISYGDGSTASGPVYTDTVTAGGLSAKSQAFSAVTTESQSFAQDPSDGIMGLAFSSISAIGAPTFIENLASQGAVSTPAFSMFLASNNSELYFGGTNPSLYSGSITYTDLVSKTYWLVNGTSSVGGTEAYSGGMIIDSGTTLIVGPRRSVEAWWENVEGVSRCSESVCGASGFYTFPCNSPPTVAFSFGGVSYSVSPDYFNLGAADNTGETCVGALASSAGVPDNAWIVGDVFMRNVYTVFDEANSRVGFANLANQATSVAGAKSCH